MLGLPVVCENGILAFVVIFIALADVGYKRLGCYNDKEQEDRPLPELLFTDRDELSPVYSGKKYTKENYDRPYLDDLVERCALKSKKMGYNVFGIERFGMSGYEIHTIALTNICNLKTVFRSLPCPHRIVRTVVFCLIAKKALLLSILSDILDIYIS